MKFIIYETTNKITGKKYRGAHVCKTLDDGYLGSGKLLLKAIAKYGIENFERHVLKECDSVEDMYQQESIFVDKEWVESENTYNLKVGGEGGFDYIHKHGKRWNDEKRLIHSIEMKKKRSSGEWGPLSGIPANFTFKNKKHSEESKKKISENNASNLNEDVVNKRISDWNSLKNEKGKITKLSKMWNVSHTQVRRFAVKNKLPMA